MILCRSDVEKLGLARTIISLYILSSNTKIVSIRNFDLISRTDLSIPNPYKNKNVLLKSENI